MKIFLIHTNNFSFGPLDKRVDLSRGLNPPISLAYIAASVRAANHEVKIIDMDAEKIGIKDLKNIIRKENPDLVGFSVMLNNFLVYNLLARYVKTINPLIIVVFGGIMVNLFPEEVIRKPWVDFGVIGEGESTFPLLINALETRKSVEDIPGLIYMQNGDIKKNGLAKPIQNMDSIPFPARDLLNNKSYSSVISRYSPITILFTGRGCQYHCTFCSKPDFWDHWRFFSPEYVIKELQQCSDLGIKEILIYDDVFTAYPKRVKTILTEIIKRKMDLKFDIRTRVDMINPSLLSLLKKAGCLRINYGVESGDPDILRIYRKEYSIDQVKTAFKLTKEYGMETLAYFMIGGPKESEASITRTFNLMKELDPDFLHLTYVVPYPKTQLFSMAVQMNLADEQFWLHEQNLKKEYPLMFTSPLLSQEKILGYVKKGYRQFYYRPKFIINQIARLRTFTQLKNYIKSALSIIF